MPTSINITNIEYDLKGIAFKYFNEFFANFDIKAYIKHITEKIVKKNIDKIVKKYVYSFLEESRITLPPNHDYERHITLNEYIIQITREVITNRVYKEIDKYKIEVKVGETK